MTIGRRMTCQSIRRAVYELGVDTNHVTLVGEHLGDRKYAAECFMRFDSKGEADKFTVGESYILTIAD